jgi:hypothetical protein
MKKTVKYFIVFLVLSIWTMGLAIDKVDIMRQESIKDASAITLEEARPITFYNVKNLTVIDQPEMERILFWTEHNIEQAFDPKYMNTDLELFAVKITYERQNLRKSVCAVQKLLKENPKILEKFPELKKHTNKCSTGRSNRAGLFSGGGLS